MTIKTKTKDVPAPFVPAHLREHFGMLTGRKEVSPMPASVPAHLREHFGMLGFRAVEPAAPLTSSEEAALAAITKAGIFLRESIAHLGLAR
jgi:hypothetical protein